MALNLADRIAIRKVIIDRCTAAVVNFANYILAEDPGTANHTNRLAWAREAIRDANGQGDSVSWYVLREQNFIDNGSGITDAQLGAAVETAIGLYFITPAA